jgi:hypothetical protein
MSNVVLSAELKQTINSALARGKTMTVSYVAPDNTPRLSFRGSIQAYGDNKLSIWVRDPKGGILAALEKNPSLAFAYGDLSPDSKAILMFRGKGRIERSPDLARKVYDAIPELERNLDKERKGVAVIVDLDSVEGLFAGQFLKQAA